MPLKVFGGSLLLPLRIDGYTFDQLPYNASVDERFSTQLLDQLPDFVLENYETFVQFVEAYYEWSEQHGNPRAEGVRLTTHNDVDDTIDKFLEYFRNTYIQDFPFQLAEGVNEKTLIKNVGYMYRAKGSKASFDLLFKLLFDTTIDVDYPKDRILKLSTSTFDDRQFIRIAPIFSIDEAKSIENSIIVQKDPFNREIYATALIDEVSYVHEGGVDFFSLGVQDISGTFTTESDAEIITSGLTSAAYNVPLLPTLDQLKINAGGTGYELGDTVTVNDDFENKLLKAEINNIGPFGEIRGFNYKENFGVYRSDENLNFIFETSSGLGASLSVLGEVVLTDGPDSYKDDSGKLSGRTFIQDSFFYQNFSYIIRVNKSLQQFAETVRKLVHPSGSLMFAEYINEVSMSGDAGVTSDSRTRFRPTIGHYLPHTFGTTLDPRGFTYTTDAGITHYDFYPNGYNGQDGSTSDEFLTCDLDTSHVPAAGGQAQLAGEHVGRFGIPHTRPDLGITHNPDIVFYFSARATGATKINPIPFNAIAGHGGAAAVNQLTIAQTTAYFNGLAEFETSSITSGALGGTGYIGITVDSNDESVGLMGFFPADSNRRSLANSDDLSSFPAGIKYYGSLSNGDGGARIRVAGATHYGGYTSPPETSLSGGFSGGQITQVVGTDSATADYWVVYRHPAHLGLTAIGVTGSRNIINIPLKPTDESHISTINPSNDGYSYEITRGVTLNGVPYSVGEIVTQEKQNQPKAIGRVISFTPSAYGNQGDIIAGIEPFDPYYNIGIDTLEVEVLNGELSQGNLGSDFNQDGKVDGLDLSFLLGQFAAGIHTSITYDTSWMDIPIQVMVNDIEYSNVTN